MEPVTWNRLLGPVQIHTEWFVYDICSHSFLMLSRCLMPTSLEVKEMEKSQGYMNFVDADILKK